MTTEAPSKLHEAVLNEALTGLTRQGQKTLSPWLFYDELGSQLFEQITDLPEYYLTRTERALFIAHAEDIFRELGEPVTIAELGAGSASKTGILLEAAVRRQGTVLYQPIDVSPTALDEASATLNISGLTIQPQVANYITDNYAIAHPKDCRILALYIGSSIGNFSLSEAEGILRKLRIQLELGDAILLGVDLAPSAEKPVATLLAAYDDAAGVTAAFNKNVLTRLNRELDADFNLDAFAHRARWNGPCSRIEMHLESLSNQSVRIDGRRIDFELGETIHTENSHKFTPQALAALLESAGFAPTRTLQDANGTFAVTLAGAI